MLPVDLTNAVKDSFYEIADELYARKGLLEKALRDLEITLFSLKTTMFLYKY